MIHDSRQSYSRVQENLGISLDALVEFLVRNGRLLEANVVRDDEGWLGASCDDQITQISVVFLWQTVNIFI